MKELERDKNNFYILDDRTQKYLDAVKSNMGYVDTNNSWYGIKEILDKKGILSADVEKIAEYEGYVNSSNIEVFGYRINGEQRYCAELSYQTAIDDYNVETHIFVKEPSRENVMQIREINKTILHIEIGKLKPFFHCWECGRETHWLDIPGNLEEKIEGLKDNYCGC